MSQAMQITWLRDDTVRIQAVIKDFDNSLLTPDSQQIIVTDSGGVARGTYTSPGSVGSGTYTQDYQIGTAAAYGDWRVSWCVTVGAYNSRAVAYFTVGKD